MIFPESLSEELVDQIVGRVLDHLDLFDDDLLLALDVVGTEGGIAHDVGQDVERQRQVLVEHLDVVAGVFLRGERVELSADRIDGLGDVFGSAASPVPLKSMCSTKCAMPPRSALSCREPRVSQTPMLTDLTCVIRSVRMRRPLSRTSLTIGEFDKVELAAGTRVRNAPG